MHFSMNENHFQTKVFVFKRGQPSDINSGQTPIIYFLGITLRCISIGLTLTIEILYGQPSDVYQFGRFRRLIICGQPSDVYQLGRLRRISIGHTPMIDIIWNQCISIGQTPTIDIVWTTLQCCSEHTSINNIVGQPSETILSRNHLMHSLLLF